MHIALARSDNMGDLLFTLPLVSSLKKNIPDLKITLIARDYVKDIADASPYIDHFLSHDQLLKMEEDIATDYLKKHQIDSILILKGNKNIFVSPILNEQIIRRISSLGTLTPGNLKLNVASCPGSK